MQTNQASTRHLRPLISLLVASSLLAFLVVVLVVAVIEADCQQTARGKQFEPWELVWLRIKTDPKLASPLDWIELAASRGDSIMTTLAKKKLLNVPKADPSEPHALRLYRVQEIDLHAEINQLHLEQREKFYLTSDDLIN